MRSRAPDQDIHRFARDAAPTPLRGEGSEGGGAGFGQSELSRRASKIARGGWGSGVARGGTRHALDAHELADVVRASLEVDAEVGRLGLERGPRRLAAIGGSPKRSRDVARVLETELVANDDGRGGGDRAAISRAAALLRATDDVRVDASLQTGHRGTRRASRGQGMGGRGCARPPFSPKRTACANPSVLSRKAVWQSLEPRDNRQRGGEK